MNEALYTELQEHGRGIVGALLVIGVADLYTMEMWWHGWQLPTWLLVAYAVVGLGLVLVVTRHVGFRDSSDGEDSSSFWTLIEAFAELVLQSFVAATVVLLLFGIVDTSTPLGVFTRLMLAFVVPLGFGAAITNALLTGDKEDEQTTFPKNLALFALGAVFIIGPVSPTQEMAVIAMYAGWWHLAALVVASVAVSYLILFELDFMGQQHRAGNRSRFALLTESVNAYVVALVVSAGLLASYGQFLGAPPTIWLQKAVVLGFPGTIGASAAHVVVG